MPLKIRDPLGIVTMCLLGTHAWAETSAAQRAAPQLPTFQSPAWVSTHDFDMISSVLEMSDGRVLVADLQTPAVHLLGRDGRLVRTIGRKGAGPGEYTEPRSVLAYRADSTCIVDRAQRRVVILTSAGTIARTELLPTDIHPSANDLRSDGRGALYFLKSAFMIDSVPTETVPLLRWRFGQSRTDSLAAMRPAQMKRTVTKDQSGREMSFSTRIVDYSPQDDFAVAPDGSVAIIRAVPYHVEWLLPNGQRVKGPVQPFTAIPVAAAERAPYLGDLVPKTKPAFSAPGAFTDPFGRVWVRHYIAAQSTTRQWSVFDRQGARVTTITLPKQLELVFAGQRGVYTVRRDANDLESLELHAWR